MSKRFFLVKKFNGRYVRNDVCPAAHVLRPCLYISDIKNNTRKLSAHFLSPRKTGLSSLKNRLTKSINFIFTRALLVCVYIYFFHDMFYDKCVTGIISFLSHRVKETLRNLGLDPADWGMFVGGLLLT